MAVILLLMISFIVVTYSVSFNSVYQNGQKMLTQYCDLYFVNGNPSEQADIPIGLPLDGEPPNGAPSEAPPDSARLYSVSRFYSVAFDSDENIKSIDNGGNVLSDNELTEIARKVLSLKKADGKIDSLIYQTHVKESYTLVAFVDETAIDSNIGYLVSYTLIFGAFAVVVVFVIALFVSKRIISPLEQNDHRQRQFVSDAGHELKTPVSVVNTNAEMLHREIGENRWLDNIVYENKKMASLIQRLMELSKTENRKPEMSETNFSRIVLGEALAFESVAYEKSIHYRDEEIAEHILIKGNQAQLTELVSILLDNALSYCPLNGTVSVSLRGISGKAVLRIANSCEPVSQVELNRVFERFYRLSQARSDDGHYGLGLSIAKAIVQSHSGDISAAYENGEIIFTVRIPQK